MPCHRVKLDGAPLGAAIVCTRGRRPYRCGFCTLAGGMQCDWKVSPGKTCDAYICPEHALEVDKDKHLCPVHQQAYVEWKKSREVKCNRE
jgi:hypothetical protein